MTNNQFYKRYFEHVRSMSSEAARLVLVEGKPQVEACKITGANKGTLNRLLSNLKPS